MISATIYAFPSEANAWPYAPGTRAYCPPDEGLPELTMEPDPPRLPLPVLALLCFGSAALAWGLAYVIHGVLG